VFSLKAIAWSLRVFCLQPSQTVKRL